MAEGAGEVVVSTRVRIWSRRWAPLGVGGPGRHVGEMTLPANLNGYTELLSWSRSMGEVEAYGVEGTGS